MTGAFCWNDMLITHYLVFKNHYSVIMKMESFVILVECDSRLLRNRSLSSSVSHKFVGSIMFY